jgi:DNA-binding transcriptional LysR family regulator
MHNVNMQLDLNLLRVFDALMEHRSVTHAARHLGLSQPAVSHALSRLRAALDDPVFIRAQSGLQPTTRAEEMADDIRSGLLQFQRALAAKAFEPARSERHFTLAGSNYFCMILMPALERIKKDAPGISLRLVPVPELLVALLDRGELDLMLGPIDDAPKRIVVEAIGREKMVWVGAPDNPIVREKLTADQFDDDLRILIAPVRGAGAGNAINEDAGGRDFGNPVVGSVTVYDSQTAIALAARTKMVARVPQRLAALAVAQGDVVTLDWLGDELSFDMTMVWHSRQKSDKGLAWLRSVIRDVLGTPGTI